MQFNKLLTRVQAHVRIVPPHSVVRAGSHCRPILQRKSWCGPALTLRPRFVTEEAQLGAPADRGQHYHNVLIDSRA